MALSAYLSPHLIWHEVSSSAELHSWRQTKFSRHWTSPRHVARADWQLRRRQLPTALESVANAVEGDREMIDAAVNATRDLRNWLLRISL
jgi:hypothetical protein